jgi:meso-butanediol dehydrogenase/(S,S)-butanediol dehydrogenase/diacetyl reductase
MASDRKVAIVTGAAQGIGRSITLRLAKDGFDVALADLSSSADKVAAVAAEAEALGVKTARIACDVRKEADVYAMVEQTVKELGQVNGKHEGAGQVDKGAGADPKSWLPTLVSARPRTSSRQRPRRWMPCTR